MYDGRGQAGETLLSALYPKHTPMLENFIPGDVMMHGSTSGDILALQGESKAWRLEELALSAALFMPIGARSVCPSSQMPPQCLFSELGLTRHKRSGAMSASKACLPVGVFLFGLTDVQKGNIKSWHINKHIKILGEY